MKTFNVKEQRIETATALGRSRIGIDGAPAAELNLHKLCLMTEFMSVPQGVTNDFGITAMP